MKWNLTFDRTDGLVFHRIVVATAVFVIALFGAVEAADAQSRIAIPSENATHFQYSVKIDGDFAVIGAEWHDDFKGAAYVLRREGTEWVVERKLSPADLGPYDHFGGSVTISGDYVVVGASWHDTFRGAAYVFERADGEWVQRQKLTASDAAPGGQFAEMVSIDGGLITVGARSGDTPAPGKYTTYHFKRSGERWAESEKLTGAGMATAPPLDYGSTEFTGVVNGLAVSGLVGDEVEPPPLPAAPPPPVSIVTATNGTLEDRVEVRWSSVGLDAIVYKVLRNGVLLSIVASNDSLYKDTTGALNTTYSYCIVVKDMAAQESTPVCADGRRIIYSPASVSATDGLFVDRVTINWVDISKIEDGYYVYRDGARIDSTGPNASWVNDTTGQPDSVYNYEVRAFAAGVQSAAGADNGWRGVVLPPVNVSATDGEYMDLVVITWQYQLPDTFGARIYRDSVLIGSAGANVTSFEDTSVVFGDIYTYCVAAVDTLLSESVWVCDEGGTGLTPPANVSASDSTYDDRITITWDDLCLSEDGYEIARALAPDTVVLDTTRANAEVYHDLTAVPDVTYTYFVRAVNDLGGVSAAVSDDGFKMIVLAPENIQATDGDFEDHVNVTWESRSKTAVLFKISRDGTFIKTLSVGNSKFSDYGGTAGQVYDYNVVASTALEDENAGVPDEGSRELSTPSSVAASDKAYEDKIVVSWVDNSQLEHGYAITREDTSGAPDDTTFVIGPNRSAYTDYNAIPGVTYSYSVSAFDSASGTVGYSAPAEDLGLRVLRAPTKVQAGDGEYEEQVEITWQDNSNAEDGYRIYRDDVFIGETADNFTTYIDTSPDLGVTHVYSVAAYDSVLPAGMGESERASDTGYTTILAPVSFNASDVYEDRIELAWVDASNVETGFKIFRNLGGSTPMDSIGVVGPNVTFYTDFPPGGSDVFRYCIQAFRDSTLISDEACDYGSRWQTGELETVGLSLKLEIANLDAGDKVGMHVAVNNDVAIAEARYDDDRGTNAGAAYLFEREPNGNWVRRAKLTASDGAAGDQFGTSAAISGDLAIVGAYADDGYRGAAYVFERQADGSWPQKARLVASDRASNDWFGISVAITGSFALIGAKGDDSNTGSVYVFDRETNGSWTYRSKLRPAGITAGEYFGVFVAVSGNTAIVGSDYDDSQRGSAFLYERTSSGDWPTPAKLQANDGVAWDRFGCWVGISGEAAIVGAMRDNNERGQQAGAAYIFEPDEFGDWTRVTKLTAEDGADNDEFGYSVGISGSVAVVGAWANEGKGAAYVFSQDPGTGDWIQKGKVIASDGAPGDKFAQHVAVSGDVAVVGAHEHDGAKGAAYVLEMPRSPVAVSASDGAYDSRVRVSWDDVSSNEDGFRVYRDGGRIANVGENVEVYEDFDAEPGRTHEYSVAAFRSDVSVELERVSDFGWRPPNGNITGRISALGGGASEGIYVGLDPLPTKALLFDGAGGYVSVPDLDSAFDFGAEDSYTIEAWFKYLGNGGSGSGGGTLIAKAAPRGSGPRRFPFWLGNMRSSGEPGRVRFTLSDGVTTVGVSSRSTSLNDNRWHHVACVHDADLDEISIYIDGNLEGITPYTVLGDITNADSLSLGAGAKTGSWFGGQIDEVRIWNVVRSETDIQATMTVQPTGDEAGLVCYWPLDEGSIGVITDPFSADHYGVFYGGVYWTENSAPLEIFVQTGQSGNYVLSDLHYGNETTFKVRPFEGNRQFEPPFTMITLSVDHPVENQVNFVDISSYTLSGVVMYGTTGCPAANVSILVDGRIVGFTDKNGKYAVSVDNGSHSVRPELAGHVFTPDSVSFFVDDDVDGLVFKDLTKYTLSGFVGGGCNHQIGDVTITIRSENGCLTETITAVTAYSISLPPQTYLVSAAVDIATIPEGLPKADVVRFFQDLGDREAVLDSSDVTLDMMYRAPLEVTIQGLESYIPDCEQPLTFDGQPLPANLPVLEQANWYGVLIEVYENYGSQGLCPLDTGTVVIYDEIADREGTPIEIGVKNGVASYTTYACTPSLVLGRVDSHGNDRSFQKAIRAMAVVEGRSPVSTEEWVIVTGHVAEEGADFVTAKLNDMLYILRDPPGDQSYSFVEKGFSLRKKTDFQKTISTTQTGVKVRVEYGYAGTSWFGFGGGTEFNYEMMSTVENEALFGIATHYEKGTDFVYGTKERFTTSPNERFIGEQNDVFIGAGLNYIFSVVQYVEVDLDKCEVLKYPGFGFEQNGIETIYAYTRRYIEDSLIPEIESKVEYFLSLGEDHPDYKQAGTYDLMREDWEKILAWNNDLKLEAQEIEDGDRSFSGGTEYSFVRDSVWTTSVTDIKTFIFDLYAEPFGFGFETDFGAYRFSIPVKSHIEYLNPEFWEEGKPEQGMEDWTKTTSKSVGYVLSDDNIGDRFNVKIKRDGVFPSLAFDVMAGASSCPYEAWPDLETSEPRMMSRDKPVLYIDPPQGRQNVPPDEEAVFTLTLANMSPTDEARRYVLREVATANPNGALIRANGVFINDDLVYYPEGGQSLNLTVTVERGPEKYDYDNLALMVYPLCEWYLFEIDGPLNLADTVFFDVTFEAPCSDISMVAPEPGWASTRDHPDVDILLDGFELKIGEDNDLTDIVAQYRRLGSGDEGPTEWVPIFSVPPPHPDSLQEMYYQWTPPATLPDGEYELRAKTQCDNGFIYSDPVSGTIDRHAPVVFGTPEPADGDLSLGEDIRVTFNEPIACTSVDSNNVGLSWLDGPNAGLDLPFETTCNGNGIVITPTASDTDLEGRQLQARVNGIRDRVGNAMEDTVTWIFNYRKSRFAWSELYLVRDVPYRNPGVIAAELANGTGESVEFAVTELPAWITGATPPSGTILPGQRQSVSLTLDPALTEGVYEGRIAAETAGPDQKLAAFDIHVTVSCHDPGWIVYPNNYEHSMTMVASLMIEGAPSEEASDRLAAFVGNQLRGVANVELVPVGIDNYAAFLTVYSNRAQGETVRFQIWDDNNCKLYNATVESFPFVANGQIGSPGTPVTLTATEVLGDSMLAIDVDEGWNWFSTNIRSLDMSATSALSNLTPASGDIVKSQTAFSQFVADTTGWAPVLLLDNVSGYMLRLSQPGTILHTGGTVPVDSVIPVSQGWNWIGYLPGGPIDVTEALDDLRVQAIAQDDDIIKSQDGFAQYVNSHGAWYGSLDSMRTGEGYKLYLDAAGDHTFNYPAYVPSPSPPAITAVAARDPEPVEGEPEWSVNPRAYQYNMTVTSVLRIGGTESADPNDVIGAFVGDECRGVASPVYVDGIRRYVVFLMVYSNAAEGEEVTFRAFDAGVGLVYDVKESLGCKADAVEGTVLEPLVLNTGSVREEKGQDIPVTFGLAQNYPNPFNPKTVIGYDVPAGGGTVTLRIYDVGGRLVRTLVDGVESPGRKSIAWHGRDNRGNQVATGVYFYRMTAPGFEKTRKMVLLK